MRAAEEGFDVGGELRVVLRRDQQVCDLQPEAIALLTLGVGQYRAPWAALVLSSG
jgi:hypothetical protein